MLKLSQIKLLNDNDIIVEILEPIIYLKVGSIQKTDEIISREKANMYYLVATVVKVKKPSNDIKVGDNIIVTRNSFEPIQFPIEGYDSPVLANVNAETVYAILEEETEEVAL